MSPYHMMLHTHRELTNVRRLMGCGDHTAAYEEVNKLLDDLTEKMKIEAARRGGLTPSLRSRLTVSSKQR